MTERLDEPIPPPTGRFEVWDGANVVLPVADVEHQALLLGLVQAILSALEPGEGAVVLPSVNVSDREGGWFRNFRTPDVAVVLAGGDARDLGTHVRGGPDFLVEILGPDDPARHKRAFYAGIGVRELLTIARDPWALELDRLDGGVLQPVGRSTVGRPDLLVSTVLPLILRLVPGEPRPRIEVRSAAGKRLGTV